jgi:hypothetical protein
MAALAAAVAVGAASGAHRAAADTASASVYSDASGDSATAPDITNVTMTPGAGTVRIDVTFAGALAPDGDLGLLIDADRNAQTGKDGVDYLILMESDGYYDQRWNGSDWEAYPHQPLQATLSDTQMEVTLTLADLGGITTFDFAVVSLRGNDVDSVPDSGVATYPAVVPPPTIKAVILPSVIFRAKAGATLRLPKLQLQMSNATVVPVTSQACTLTWKGKRLPALGGGCAWAIPKKAKGARLTLKVTYVYAGASHVVTWAVVPR